MDAIRRVAGLGALLLSLAAVQAHAQNFTPVPARTIGPYTSAQSGGPWTAADDRTIGASLTGQNGWTSASGCAPAQIDDEISHAAAHGGNHSLRISNWFTSPCVDSIVSPTFAAVGAPGSKATGSNDPAVTNTATYSFWFRSASTTPDPGLSFTTQFSALASYRLTYLAFLDSAGNQDGQCTNTPTGFHLKTIGIAADDGTLAGNVTFTHHCSPTLTRGAWYQVVIAATFDGNPLNDVIDTQVLDSNGAQVWQDTSNSWGFGYYAGFFNGHTTSPRPVQGPFAAEHVTFDISASTGPGPSGQYASASATGTQGIYFDDMSVTPGSGAAYSTSFNGDRWVAPNGSDTANDCSAQSSPCQTIANAIGQANPYDTIHVASGIYDLGSNPALAIAKDGLTLKGEGATRPQIRRTAGGINQALLVINGAKSVQVQNLEFDMDQSFVAEGIIANGFVDGLSVDGNTFIGSQSLAGTPSDWHKRNAISINDDNGNSQSIGTAPGSSVSITNNTISSVNSSTVYLRMGVDMDSGVGTISGNTITAAVHDIRVRFSTSTSSAATLIDNNTLNGRGLELDAPNSSAGAITISNNHINAPAASGGCNTANCPADFSLVRLMSNPAGVAVAVTGNTFAGYQGSYRGVLVENFPNTAFTGNTFTPASGVSDFVSLVVSNKALNSDSPPDAPLQMSITANGNTFNGSGVANAGRAVEFLNDNASGATFGNLAFGASGTNSFDGNLRWYFHLDDYNCETVNSPTCAFLNYAGAIGNNAATNTDVRPFTGNVNAANNTFDGASPSSANAAAILARTYDHTANSALGVVNYSLSGFNTVYVDATYAGNYGDAVSFTSPAPDCGAGAPQSGYFGINAFASITQALAHVNPAGFVCVAKGRYAEADGAGGNLTVAKAVKIIGAQEGVDARTRDIGGAGDANETIIVPAVADLAIGNSAVVQIDSDGVTLDGLVIDGDNPAISSNNPLNGADPDETVGVFASANNTLIRNSVFRNFPYAGFDGYGTGSGYGPAGGNLLTLNRFTNINPTSWGIGIVLQDNFYAQVTGNLMDLVRVGVQTNNNSQAAPGGFAPSISGNEIHATRTGVFHNLFYGSASTYTISNNQLIAAAYAPQAGQWQGLWVETMQDAQTVTILGNTIDGSALSGARNTVGYLLNYIPSSAASTTAIDGGSVSNVAVGVLSTDATAYTGAVNDFLVRNVAFSNVSLGAYYVEDTNEQSGSAKLTVGTGNTYANVAHKLVLSGTSPAVAGAVLDDVFVRSARNYYFNATGGGPSCTSTPCTVANASINAGIADVASGGTVTVEAGTFAESVVVNKPVTLLGPFHGVAGTDGSRGTNEANLSPATGKALQVNANNVTFDGFTIQNVTDTAIVSGGNYGGSSDTVSIRNNRVMHVGGSGSGLYTNGPNPAVTNWTVSNNLFDDIQSSSGSGINLWKVGGTLNTISGNTVTNSAFGGIQVVVGSNVQVTGNTVSNTAHNGIQVTQGTGVVVKGNTVTGANTGAAATEGGVTLGLDSSGVSVVCNIIGGSGTNGVSTVSGTLDGPGNPSTGIKVFDNTITASSAISNNFAQPIAIGSNWYGGGNPSVGGSNAAGAQVADPLPASPIGQAACGDNTPTQIVAYKGSGQTTPINTAFGNPLVARVQDALGGAVMASQAVTFAPPASGASATLGTLSGNTDFNGTLGTTATANGLAGSYAVNASSGALNAGPGFALTNDKGTGTLVWDTTSFVYSGSNVTPTAHISEESGATCTFTPASVGPNVGSYSVAANCASANYTASGSTTVSITQASATFALSHLVQAYDGAPKSVLVTPTPSTVSYSVSYVGTGSTSYGPSMQAPVQVGTYMATATSTNPNYAGSNSAALQIVAGSGDIALVVNGPVDPIHVGDPAQFAATMLANPALHQGQTFAYRLLLSKSAGDAPLALSDISKMEVFYGGNWVDMTTIIGGPLPLVPDGSGNLVYTFPDGIPGYTNGFPILDPSWTWNVRFTFATKGTYTTGWTLEDGITHAAINPPVTGSAAVVVLDALPPTDIHLVLGGPAEAVQANTPVEYTGTMLADPSQHVGENFFVRVKIGKAGGTHALTAADLSAVEIYYQGSWQPLPAGSFQPDGSGNLVYDFPQPADPSGFQIQDPQWTWNFRITYADTGVYTATANVIHAADAGQASPQVFASAAISTTVIAQVIPPPTMSLVLLGPVDDVLVHAPAEYTGTIVANPAQVSGRTFYVRVRLSKNGGAVAMTPADLEKMELYNGGWVDATTQIKAVMQADGNDLVYYFPQPNAAFSIDQTVWSWHLRFTYADAGVYSANADVIDSTDAPLLGAASLANAAIDTTVIAPSLTLGGQTAGAVTDASTPLYTYTQATTHLSGPALGENVLANMVVTRGGGATAGDVDLDYFALTQESPSCVATTSPTNGWWCPLLLIDNGDGTLSGSFGPPTTGFPLTDGVTSYFRSLYHHGGQYTVAVSLDGITSGAGYASANQTIDVAQLALGTSGPASANTGATVDSSSTLTNTGTAAISGGSPAPVNENVIGQFTIASSAGALATSDLTLSYLNPLTSAYDTIALTANGDGTLSGSFGPSGGFPVAAAYNATSLFRTVFAKAGNYTVTTRIVGVASNALYAQAAQAVAVSASTSAIAIDAASLSQTYNGGTHPVIVNTTPAGLAYTVTYDGSATPPTNAGDYTVVATITASGYSGTDTQTLHVAKAVGTVTFGATNFTFDGTAHSTTAVIAQEPGNATACVLTPAGDYPRLHAGSTSVSAACSGTNYTASASTSLVVSPLPVTLTLSGLGSYVYDGSDHAAMASVGGAVAGYPATLTITYNGGLTQPNAVGVYNVLATLNPGDYTASPASGTIQITAVPTPNVVVSISDGRDYVQYGKKLAYTIVLVNTGTGTASNLAVDDVLPVTLTSATWKCASLSSGATCGATAGSGDLHDIATLPANGVLIYTLTAIVNDDQSLATDVIVDTVTAGSASASDTTQAVIFRDGFETGGDGAQETGFAQSALTQLDDVSSTQSLTPGASSVQGIPQHWLRGTDASGRTVFGVDVLHVGKLDLMRLSVSDDNGNLVPGDWQPLAQFALGLSGSAGKYQMRAGGQVRLQLALPSWASLPITVYAVH